MKFKKIYITGGHGKSVNGRNDPGAIALDGTTEREVIVGIGDKISSLLQKEIKDETVLMAGFSENLTLYEKEKAVDDDALSRDLDYTNSLIIDLHCDYREASEGVAGYYFTGDENAKSVLNTFLENLSKDTNRKYKWIKGDKESRFESGLYIIQNTEPLAILIEMGTLLADSNTSDGLELLKSDSGQSKIAESIVRTLRGYLESDSEEIEDIPSNQIPHWADQIARLMKNFEATNDLEQKERILEKVEAKALRIQETARLDRVGGLY